jgi:hypothetical protein
MTTQAVPTIQAAAAAGAIAGLPASKPAYGKETAQVVLDIIRLNPEHHDQHSWVNECGTTACIAGWVALLHPEMKLNHVLTGAIGLEISLPEADRLFFTFDNDQAVHALEYLAKGEPIDWQAVRNS